MAQPDQPCRGSAPADVYGPGGAPGRPDPPRPVGVTVNGKPSRVPAGTTVGDLVRELTGGGPARGVAVARNGTVVPRSAWQADRLTDGDRVEVLTATQGG